MKSKKWTVAKSKNRRILLRKTRNGFVKLLFKRLDDSGEQIVTVPLLLSPLTMDTLCSLWMQNRERFDCEQSRGDNHANGK